MTRLFRDGRTETIRSLSKHSVAFVRAMLDKRASSADRIAALRLAADKHQVRPRSCLLARLSLPRRPTRRCSLLTRLRMQFCPFFMGADSSRPGMR